MYEYAEDSLGSKRSKTKLHIFKIDSYGIYKFIRGNRLTVFIAKVNRKTFFILAHVSF